MGGQMDIIKHTLYTNIYVIDKTQTENKAIFKPLPLVLITEYTF